MKDFSVKQKIRGTVDEEKKMRIKKSVREQKGRITEGGARAKKVVRDAVGTAEQKARELEEDVNIEIEETENAYLRLVLYFRDKQITTRQSPTAEGVGLSVDIQSLDRNRAPLLERSRTDRTPDIKAS